jgi:hypothetical protein
MDLFPILCKIEKLQELKIGLLKVFMKSSFKGECFKQTLWCCVQTKSFNLLFNKWY